MTISVARLYGPDSPWAQQPPLPASVTTLTVDGKSNGQHTMYVIGTAHISQKSVDEVRSLINRVRPNSVVVELCSGRSNMLFLTKQQVQECSKITTELIKKHGLFTVLYSHMMSKASEQLDVLPGAEFKAAYEACLALPRQPRFVFGDRPVHITIKRLWASLSVFQKVRFSLELLHSSLQRITEEDVEAMKSSDNLFAALKDMGSKFPSVTDVLVRERDQYLACRMHEVAMEVPVSVAVIGMGHVPGIQEAWATAHTIDKNALCKIENPSPRPHRTKVVVVAGVVLLGGIILLRRRRR